MGADLQLRSLSMAFHGDTPAEKLNRARDESMRSHPFAVLILRDSAHHSVHALRFLLIAHR